MISTFLGYYRRFRTAEVEKDFLEKPLWERRIMKSYEKVDFPLAEAGGVLAFFVPVAPLLEPLISQGLGCGCDITA